MNLPSISVKRPITVFMVSLIVLLFGVVSLTKLPVELYANTDFSEISIIIGIRGGMPPTEVEASVTKIVEEGVATVSNLKRMLSISKEGESTVVLSFQPGTDMDFAALEVREKFAKIKDQLPKDIEKPVIAQFQQNDVPIFIVSAISPVRSTEDIRKIVGDLMKENLRRVPGVANVELAGGRERKIMVDGDQVKLYRQDVTLDDVTSKIGANNLNLLSGELKKEKDKTMLRMIGEIEDVDGFKKIAVKATDQGSMTRVEDVANVTDGYAEPGGYSRLNVKPVVTIYIQKESSKNTIKVAEDVENEIESLKSRLPKDIRLVVTSNQAVFIKKAIDNLTKSLMEGVILIILVFFMFLYDMNWKRVTGVAILTGLTLFAPGELLLQAIFVGLLLFVLIMPKYRPIIVVTAPIPVSVIGTFIFMRSAGLSLNVMTLFGLALGVGMLIDNAIVVFENILKKIEEGKDKVQASMEGADEMFLTLIASTATNVIVFLPMIFMGEELKRLYSGMASTIVVSLGISLICSATIVPMMSALSAFSIGRIHSERKKTKSPLEKKIMNFERSILFRMIRYRYWLALACIVLFSATFWFASKMGTEYLGSTEQSKFTIFIELPSGAKLDVSNKIVGRVEKLIQKIPEVKNFSSRVEGWSSKVYVELVSSSERKMSISQIIDMIRPETDRLKPAFIYFSQEEQVGTKDITIEIFGFSYEKLRELAVAVSNKMQEIKGLSDVKIRMREGRPEMQVMPDKKRARGLNFTTRSIADQVHAQMRGLRATEYHTEGREVEAISRIDEKYRKTFKDLHKLILTNDSGDATTLDDLSSFRFGLGPSEIWRKNKSRTVQVSATLGKVPLSKVANDLIAAVDTIPFPDDYYYEVGGDYPVMVKSQKQLRMMIAFVLVLVYLVLGALFESVYQPILIIVAVPLALMGAIAALYMGPKTIGVGAMLGLMMLGGIVVNNSIMLIDRINQYRKENIGSIKSAVLANKDRTRPILMTVSTTILGLLPMAIDKSEGANLWSPLASTVIGGIVSSTFLTLLVMPAFYIISINISKSLSKFTKTTN